MKCSRNLLSFRKIVLLVIVLTTAGCDSRSSLDLKTLDSKEIIEQAELALDDNDTEFAIAAVLELQGRKKDTVIRREIGRLLFGVGAMKESAAIHDEMVEKMPNIMPRLWQRGIALYYAGEYQKGVEQFEAYQTFSAQDVENSVWHLLCQARLTPLKEARENMIMIEGDRRVPMQQIFNMFAGTGTAQEVLDACGYEKGTPRDSIPIYHGLIYVGLYHEMVGDSEASNAMMLEALNYKPKSMRGLMGYVAEGQLRANNAFPDR